MPLKKSIHIYVGESRSAVAYVLDCSLEVNEFKFQSRYYVHFQTKTFWKSINSPIHLIYGVNNVTAVIIFTQPLRSGRI